MNKHATFGDDEIELTVGLELWFVPGYKGRTHKLTITKFNSWGTITVVPGWDGRKDDDWSLKALCSNFRLTESKAWAAGAEELLDEVDTMLREAERAHER